MIDFHTHLLPGIDDGSKDMEETKAMLAALGEQGVECFVATPHFYARHSSVGTFLKERRRAEDKVRDYLGSHPSLPRMAVGAEVYYFQGMGCAAQLRELTVAGTNLLLLEMPFAQWTQDVLEDVRGLLQNLELQVVLVHVERFYHFQKNKRIWQEILGLPLTLQVNTGALSGSLLERRTALKMMKLGLPVVLGSDCHNMTSRPPQLLKGRDVLGRKLGEAAVAACDRTADELLKTLPAGV